MLFVRQSWMDTNAYSRIIIMSLELSINIIIIIINEDNLNAVIFVVIKHVMATFDGIIY